MGKNQKIITSVLWGTLVLVMVGVVVGQFWAPPVKRDDLPKFFAAPQLSLTDQDNKPFSSEQLRGHPYVVDLIFTTCGDTCPMMSAQMKSLEEHTPRSVKLVSLTVNPEHDTPEVMKAYAKRFGVDESRWHFLTGTPEQMTDAARAMKLPAKPAEPGGTILHSDKFLLFDGTGECRGIYNARDPLHMKKLAEDAKTLAAIAGAAR